VAGWGIFNPVDLSDNGFRAGGHPGGICLAREAADALATHARHPRDLALTRARLAAAWQS